MDRIIAPIRSRVDSRNQRHAQYTLTEELGRRSNPYEEEGDHADKPLLIREHKRRTIMSNSHRRFHRRAPQADGTGNVKTINVEVVATVDTAGNVVAQTTVTQLDSTAPTETSQALPVTDATDVSAPSVVAGSSVPTAVAVAAAADAASTLEVPSIASLPSETLSVVPSTPAETSQLSVPSVSAEPTVATVVALPSVPSVPAVPSVSLPSVPSVPAFPSTLTVPAYPFASSSIGAVAADAVISSSASSVAASSEPSVVAVSSEPSVIAASSEPSIVAALTAADTTNSTMSSTAVSTSSIASSIISSSPTLLSTMSGSSYSSSLGAATSRTALSSGASVSEASPSSTSPSTSLTSGYATPTESLDAAGSSSFYGSDGPGWTGAVGTGTAAAPAGTAGAADDSSEAGGTTPLDTPQVVGSVVGSLAGAALILAIILILLRRHKRRQGGALQLTDSRRTDNEQAMRQVQAPAPARASLVPSAFLNRFSGLSRSTVDTASSPTTERSFQRVSGRKLPSAFSEGMTSDQFARGGHMSDSSFYQDDHGTYGGPGGLNKEYGGDFGKEIGETSFAGGAGKMNLRPSPARTPVIRHPNDNPFDDRNTLSPPMSPNPFSSPNPELSPRAALGRSLHSADGSRSSRFTENV